MRGLDSGGGREQDEDEQGTAAGFVCRFACLAILCFRRCSSGWVNYLQGVQGHLARPDAKTGGTADIRPASRKGIRREEEIIAGPAVHRPAAQKVVAESNRHQGRFVYFSSGSTLTPLPTPQVTGYTTTRLSATRRAELPESSWRRNKFLDGTGTEAGRSSTLKGCSPAKVAGGRDIYRSIRPIEAQGGPHAY